MACVPSPPQVPENVRSILREAHRFFKQENVGVNEILIDIAVPPEKLFFIGAGSVELQVFERDSTGTVCGGWSSITVIDPRCFESSSPSGKS